ncbi:MAG: hypothetical protein ACI9OJ_000860 [Myxococcota bacterium]|jgi:hypothetical protein
MVLSLPDARFGESWMRSRITGATQGYGSGGRSHAPARLTPCAGALGESGLLPCPVPRPGRERCDLQGRSRLAMRRTLRAHPGPNQTGVRTRTSGGLRNRASAVSGS